MKIPEGWPTDEMTQAGFAMLPDRFRYIGYDVLRSVFKAMIAAAPTPPAQENEPVLYQIRMVENGNKGRWIDSDKTQYNKLNGKGWEGRKLYTHPADDKLRKAAEELAPWMSAALEDPQACAEFKEIAYAFLGALEGK